MRATAREALEAVYAQIAIEEYVAERREQHSRQRDMSTERETLKFLGGDSAEILDTDLGKPPEVDVSRSKDAQELADTPHLVSDWDEWNNLELSETDPSKDTIEVRT